MSFVIEYSSDGGSSYTTIDYQEFAAEYGVSDVLIAPITSVDTSRTTGASAGDRLRIQETDASGTVVRDIFKGQLTTGGRVERGGQTKLKAEHDIYPVFEDSVSITVSSPTDEDVYNAALSAAVGGGDFTLNYVGTPVSLGDDYDVEDRSVKRIFRDMTDRTDRVFWVGVGNTITVATRGGGGSFVSLGAGDSFRVQQYDEGDINTVRNAVTVNGTGAERVQATAEDSTSITNYGRRAKTYNYDYIRTATEAQDMADELLVADPLASGELVLGQSAGTGATDEIVNQTLAFDDSQGTGASDTLTIERQIINSGSVTVNVGEGAGVSIANVNRDSQSQDDTTEPGSVYNSDRIADGAVSDTEIEDGSILSQKLANNAVIQSKLANSAVDTAEIAAAAVEGDKVQTGTLGASKLAIVDWIPVGLSFSDDSPSAGEIAWNSHSLVYNGTEYSITSGDTSVTTDADVKFVWWDASSPNSYQVSNSKPTINSDDALVAVNDNGEANQLLQATVIHGGSIRTGTITADEISTLILTTDQLQVGTDQSDKITFGGNGFGSTSIRPENDGSCTVGTSSKRFNVGNFVNIDVQGGEAEFLTLLDGEFGEDVDEQIEIETLGGTETALAPETDGTCQLGYSGKNYSSVWAKEFVDSGTTVAGDGGDPLAGLADAAEPPEHCRVCDDDGSTEGVRINDLARELWRVCTAQQRRIDGLEARLSDLEGKQ